MRGDYQPRWADVGFWIAPDGTVSDIATIQQSTDMDDGWLALATKALTQRYLPLDVPPGSPWLIRVERYLFVSDQRLKYSETQPAAARGGGGSHPGSGSRARRVLKHQCDCG